MTSQEAVKKMVKSCIVSRKGGVPFPEIEDDYRALVGESIPYAQLGYTSLQSFVKSIDFVDVRTNHFGDSVLFVSDPKVAHIDSLVRKQKNPSNQRKRNRRPKKLAATTPRSERFTRNTKIAYTKSKWYTSSSRTKKNYWVEKNNERRDMDRFNNFNTGRTGIQNCSSSPNFHSYNDRSWSTKAPASLSSIDDNMYNYNSECEKRYAEGYRSWRFNIRVADNKDAEEVLLEPLVNGHQLIGDDFFLQLAIKNFGAQPWKPEARAGIECGLCISGQTIDDCRRRLEKTQFLSGKITILLGAVDVFRGHSLEKMVRDMKNLLDVCRDRFNLTEVTLCTIPPLANYSVRCNLSKLSVLYSFNNWIKLHSQYSPDDSYIHHYNVIDVFSKFTDGNNRTLYDYFQIDARMVSGCRYPHVLWNAKGRRLAISMLEKQ
ncbi:maternal effect protein oskar-like [Neodiprion virginianus]|uniref:maternal effect protein oskar-like n=1 Tax=Neodiprion virginianus TaxID=2961670 RepID=UPI001EE736C9|nr:maternal effect protein oskar-like [Neodiprion virginianus]